MKLWVAMVSALFVFGLHARAGATVGVARTWCFALDGRFSNSSTGFGSSGNVTVGSGRPALSGRYFLHGYTARFVYDDGHEVIAAFCFANDSKRHIVLNGKRFMRR